MSKKDERNLNITINNSDDSKGGEISLSLKTIWERLKKLLAWWVVAAILSGILSLIFALITTTTNKPVLKSLIGFSYDGIERGLDPSGRKFDINSVKNPAVVEAAITDLQLDIKELENIRNGISFETIIPAEAYDKFTVYNNILQQGGNSNLSAGEKLLETSYHPTQYTVFFDYSDTNLKDDEAVSVFNQILEDYEDYFYTTYGYNESLGNAVTAISYEDYDYAEAIDVFDNSLNSLRRYVKQLADEDDSRFRSENTGYTFDDLYEAISTIRSIDLDKISSFISVNNVTKDKDASLAYYEFRIKALSRSKEQYEEQLEAYEASIQAYEKDQVIVFGGAEEANVQSNVASAEYDKMFSMKNNVSTELAEVRQQIAYYKDRLQALKTNTNSSPAMMERVDGDLASLNNKITQLIDNVSLTAEDYYKNVTFKNAYNILVPAANSASHYLSRVIGNFKLPFIALEALSLMLYFGYAVIQAVKIDNSRITEEETEESENAEETTAEEASEKAEEAKTEDKKSEDKKSDRKKSK